MSSIYQYLEFRTVLIVAVDIPPISILGVNGNGGASIYVQDLVRFYEKFGARVTLITSEKESEKLSETLRLKMIGEIRETLRVNAPTLIHILYWKSASVILSIPECDNINKVFSPISLEAGKHKGCETVNMDVKRWKIEHDIMHQSDVIAVVSSHEATVVHDDYGISSDQIHVVMRSIDLNHFSPAELNQVTDGLAQAGGDKYILYVGRFAPSKGIDSLINTYLSFTLETATTPTLLLAGGSPNEIHRLKNEMNQTLERISYSGGRVIFLGHIAQRRLPSLYRGALVTCVPSRYEPGSRVMFESMSCGTPVLTTPTGYAEELLNSQLDPAPGWALALHDDDSEWLSVLLTLYNNPEQRETAGINARTFALRLMAFPEFCRRHAIAIESMFSNEQKQDETRLFAAKAEPL